MSTVVIAQGEIADMRAHFWPELLNSASHAVGAVVAIALLLTLDEKPPVAVFMHLSFAVLFIASASYHGSVCQWDETVRCAEILRRIDIAMIAVSIAATIYAHCTILPLLNASESVPNVLRAVAGIAAVNALIALCWGWRLGWLIVTGFLVQGGIPLALCPDWNQARDASLVALAAGILAYLIGLFVFFVPQRYFRYFHLGWHLCVIFGFVCHHLAIRLVQ